VACFCDKNRGVNPAWSFRAGGGGAACVVYLLGGVAVALCLEQAGDESPTPVLLPTLLASTASVTFLKALLLHCCSPSPTTLLELLRLRRRPWCSAMPPVAGEALNCACCAFMRSIAVGCPATLDLADVVSCGCFAAISWGGCFAASGFLAPSLVDALLLRVCWPASRRMLCRRGRLVHWRMLCRHGFVGGCFAAVVAWFVGGCFAVVAARCTFYWWMLCHRGLVSCVGNLCIGILFLQAQL
jgi:hypothetical protein